MDVAVHDLLALDPEAARRFAPWVVVRRANATSATHIAAGIRGGTRGDRRAIEVAHDAVVRRVRPVELVERAESCTPRTAALAALPLIARAARAFDLVWGPVGAAGFELATGIATTHAASDCDLAIDGGGLTRAQAVAFRAAIAEGPCRIDALVEFAAGAVALDEALDAPRWLLKAADGPRLIEPLW